MERLGEVADHESGDVGDQRTHEVAVTADMARAAIAPLERALWHQNETIAEHLRGRMKFREKLPPFGAALSAVGAALSAFALLRTRDERVVLGAATGCFVVLFFVFMRVKAVEGALRRFARRMVAATAARTMGERARRAPYSVRYELDETTLAIRVAGESPLRVDLAHPYHVVETPTLVCLFRGPRDQRLRRAMVLPESEFRQALLQALSARGATVVRLD